MSTPETPVIAAAPQWDGRRVLFEVVDHGRAVPCAISMHALQDLSSQRQFKPGDLLKCFASSRKKIEAIALAKHRARGPHDSMVLHIWSDDVDTGEDLAEPVKKRAKSVRPAS